MSEIAVIGDMVDPSRQIESFAAFLDTQPREALLNQLRLTLEQIRLHPYSPCRFAVSERMIGTQVDAAEVIISHVEEMVAIERAVTDVTRAEYQAQTLDEAKRIDYMREIARATGQYTGGSLKRAVLTMLQLHAVADFHPDLGYYLSEYGVGRRGAEGNISAFTTPLMESESYREAYAETVNRAYAHLNREKEFSQSSPFKVFLYGDGEGVLLDQIVKKMQGKDHVEIIVVDNSPVMLERQERYSGLGVTFILGDAREVGEHLSGSEQTRGVIVLGEELWDVFPCVGVRKVAGKVQESAFRISKRGDVRGFSLELSGSKLDIVNKWLAAFPYYGKMLDFGDEVGLNYSAVSIIKQIAESGFVGYFIGGDYSGIYGYPDVDIQVARAYRASQSVFRAMPVQTPGAIVASKVAVTHLSDFTADADPGLLRYAIANGMNLNLGLKMGDFMSIMLSGKLFSQAEIEEEVLRLINLAQQNSGIAETRYNRDKLAEAYFVLSLLNDCYGGQRFNWILTVGGAPDLIQWGS